LARATREGYSSEVGLEAALTGAGRIQIGGEAGEVNDFKIINS
jgi:hypothetical protein